ncbi:hypothetical protein G7Y79_00015g040080 [Physcia stellaris]|nr:hypothetical protein G7Y79_00015g040080 [Physcia stellaris]
MAGWFTSSSALDEQIERATSSSLEDIALNLEISDLIRSKSVQPRESMRSLKRRIGHKNPNIQLATLKVSHRYLREERGAHFLTEIASKEFMDNLVSLLKAYGTVASNDDVKNKILELIQTWATATEGRSDMVYVGEIYRTLQREGFQFPPKTEMASSMLTAAPHPSGLIQTSACAVGLLLALQIASIIAGIVGTSSMDSAPPSLYLYLTLESSSRSESMMVAMLGYWRDLAALCQNPRDARIDDGYDDDLKRALKMSLEEVKGHSSGGYVPQSQLQARKDPPITNGNSGTSKANGEEEDPELKAAIAASIKDMEEQKKKHAETLKKQNAKPTMPTSPSFVTPRNDFELTPVEAENINLFSTLVDRLQHQPPGTILREPQIQELYDSIGSLRPKLARSYGETMSKHGEIRIVRYYDRMLEDRLSHTYGQHSLGGNRTLLPSKRSPSTHSDQYAHSQSDYYPQRQYAPHEGDVQKTPSAYGAVNNDYGANSRGQIPPYGANIQTLHQPPAQRQDSAYDKGSTSQGYQQIHDQFSQPQMQAPSMPQPPTPVIPQSSNPNPAVLYYQRTDEQVSPPQSHYQHRQEDDYAPSLPSPEQAQALPLQHVQHGAALQQRQQQPQPIYWHQPMGSSQPSQAQNQNAAAYSSHQNYTQESFPTAPQHQPQPKAVEESLIEL